MGHSRRYAYSFSASCFLLLHWNWGGQYNDSQQLFVSENKVSKIWVRMLIISDILCIKQLFVPSRSQKIWYLYIAIMLCMKYDGTSLHL